MLGLMRTLFYVRVSNISKMAACRRKSIWNNVYLSLYARQQQNSNGYTYVFDDVMMLSWRANENRPVPSHVVQSSVP